MSKICSSLVSGRRESESVLLNHGRESGTRVEPLGGIIEASRPVASKVEQRVAARNIGDGRMARVAS